MVKPSPARRKKGDTSRSTRPHQVQNAPALVTRSKTAKRKKKEQGRQFEDQAP